MGAPRLSGTGNLGDILKTEMLNSLFWPNFLPERFPGRTCGLWWRRSWTWFGSEPSKTSHIQAVLARVQTARLRKGRFFLPTLSTSETIAAVLDPVLQSQVWERYWQEEEHCGENTRHWDHLIHFTLSPSNFAFNNKHFFRHFHSWKNSVLPNML